MADIKDTECSSIDNQVFEKFKNTVIDMLNTLNTNHFTMFLSNGAEIDISYKENLVGPVYYKHNTYFPEEKKVVKVEP